MKRNDPESINQSMRIILWQKLMTELKVRAENLGRQGGHGPWSRRFNWTSTIPMTGSGTAVGTTNYAQRPAPATQQVPCHSAASGADGGLDCHLATGGGMAGRTNGGTSTAPVPQLGPPHDRLHAPTGPTSAVRPGPAAAIPDSSGNLSTRSATSAPESLQLLLLACLLVFISLDHRPLTLLLSGPGLGTVKELPQPGASLPEPPPLVPATVAMQRWRQPSRQHDAADFLLYLHQVLNAPCLQGLWQSYDSGGILRDEGGVCPLILSGLREASNALLTSAQCHINGWHSQRHQHALVPGTEAVVLQLNRFDFSNETGIASKLDHRLLADPDILMPLWSHDSSHTSDNPACGTRHGLGALPQALG